MPRDYDVKFLGVIFDSRLTSNIHAEKKFEKNFTANELSDIFVKQILEAKCNNDNASTIDLTEYS